MTKKKFCEEPYNYIFVRVYKKITHVIHNMLLHSPGLSDYHVFVDQDYGVSTIFQLYHGGKFYGQREPEYLNRKKTLSTSFSHFAFERKIVQSSMYNITYKVCKLLALSMRFVCGLCLLYYYNHIYLIIFNHNHNNPKLFMIDIDIKICNIY